MTYEPSMIIDETQYNLLTALRLARETGCVELRARDKTTLGYVVEPWQYELLLATKPVPPADDTASLLRAILEQLERQTAIMRECAEMGDGL